MSSNQAACFLDNSKQSERSLDLAAQPYSTPMWSIETVTDRACSSPTAALVMDSHQVLLKRSMNANYSENMGQTLKGVAAAKVAQTGHVVRCCCVGPFPAQYTSSDPSQCQPYLSTCHGMNGNTKFHPIHGQHERKRDKAKRFMREKGPRIAGAAATIAMFVFNIVSICC